MLHQFTRSNCMLWDYWFGWVKNIYDSVIFQFWRIKHTFVEVKLKLYIIIGDIAHPVRQWMYCLFEGVNIALLERKKKLIFFYFWTRYYVKITLNILKCRWKLTRKWYEINLMNMQNFTSICIVLHNVCIVKQ